MNPFQSLIDKIDKTKLQDALILFYLDGKPYTIMIKSGEVTVEEREVIAPNTEVRVSLKNFDKLVAGTLGPKWAYVSGKLRITGDRHLLEALL